MLYINFRPLTLSESLAKFAQKIDFSKTQDISDIKEEEKSDEDNKDVQSNLNILVPAMLKANVNVYDQHLECHL